MASEAKKELIKFTTDAATRRALKLRAALDDVDLQVVINSALKQYLAEQIEEVIKRGLVERPPADVRRPGKK
jgi:hypothetical protein